MKYIIHVELCQSCFDKLEPRYSKRDVEPIVLADEWAVAPICRNFDCDSDKAVMRVRGMVVTEVLKPVVAK